MAMTPEAKVKKKIVEQLKALGCYYFFPATGGYGKSGVPDIALAGGVAAVVNELNMRDIEELLGDCNGKVAETWQTDH